MCINANETRMFYCFWRTGIVIIVLDFSNLHVAQEPHGGHHYPVPHRRLHVYAHVADLRYLPSSRMESAFVLCAAMSREESFDADYMTVLRLRALEELEVYTFDGE